MYSRIWLAVENANASVGIADQQNVHPDVAASAAMHRESSRTHATSTLAMGECLFSSEEQCHLSVRQRMLKPLTFRATQLRNARVLFIFRGNRCLVFERN